MLQKGFQCNFRHTEKCEKSTHASFTQNTNDSMELISHLINFMSVVDLVPKKLFTCCVNELNFLNSALVG